MKSLLNNGLVSSVGIGMLFMMISIIFSSCAYSEGNLFMRGALVTEPCVVAPGDESINLDFGAVVDKYLYLNQRTHGQEFRIRLSECDLSLGNFARISFSGNENLKLPGLIAINTSSQASGIGIGLENEGKPVQLNSSGKDFKLNYGKNYIVFKAYLQGEREALADHLIKMGRFDAVVTFRIEYE